jgi:hypothetical protein
MVYRYGLPGVEVVGPDGEVSVYLIRQVPPERGELRAYVVVKEDGTENRCAEHASGRWTCTCKAFVYRKRWDVRCGGKCKHLAGLLAALEPEATEVA